MKSQCEWKAGTQAQVKSPPRERHLFRWLYLVAPSVGDLRPVDAPGRFTTPDSKLVWARRSCFLRKTVG